MNKYKLFALLFAAFTAGEIRMRLRDQKELDQLKAANAAENNVEYLKGYRDGWGSALSDPVSVRLAHDRLTRPSDPETNN